MADGFDCLFIGCLRHEKFLEPMKSHLYHDHGVDREEMAEGVQYAHPDISGHIRARRIEEMEAECSRFARAIAALGGGDDFVFEAGG